MTGQVLSPALTLMVQLIAEGRAIQAFACPRKPMNVTEMRRIQLGTGWVDANGGEITMHRDGVVTCIAYDVEGRLAVTTTEKMPARVKCNQRARVGALVTRQ